MGRLKRSLFIFSAVILIMVSCKKKQVREDSNGSNVPDTKSVEKIDKKYLTEGFLSKSHFRSVIIATREECEEGIPPIEEKSRNRALVSLQKYIQSTGQYAGANSRARLLDLINRNGKFSPLKKECARNNIYYYDIEKVNLKGYLKRISIR